MKQELIQQTIKHGASNFIINDRELPLPKTLVFDSVLRKELLGSSLELLFASPQAHPLRSTGVRLL